MRLKPLGVLAGLGLLPLIALTAPVAAQPSALNPPGTGMAPSYSLPPGPARRRIEIHPQRLLYRRCADWYELQHRPSGTVLYPRMHCWWVRG